MQAADYQRLSSLEWNRLTTNHSTQSKQPSAPWPWIIEFLEESILQSKAYKPEDTNQVWVDFTEPELSQDNLKTLLVDQAKVGLTPGTWFGEPNENFYRMNIATRLSEIQTSFQLLKNAIGEYDHTALAASSAVNSDL